MIDVSPLQVNTATLNLDHAYIQITYVVPYFSTKELEERKCKFERENNISRFTFETPFTQDGKTHGNVTRQCMRKTILTSKMHGYFSVVMSNFVHRVPTFVIRSLTCSF